jgi:hypothetical protein
VSERTIANGLQTIRSGPEGKVVADDGSALGIGLEIFDIGSLGCLRRAAVNPMDAILMQALAPNGCTICPPSPRGDRVHDSRREV